MYFQKQRMSFIFLETKDINDFLKTSDVFYFLKTKNINVF